MYLYALNETLPACCSQGHQIILKPGERNLSNLPSLSTTTTSDVETHKQQGQHIMVLKNIYYWRRVNTAEEIGPRQQQKRLILGDENS
jgi:hypothetical protein